MARTDEFKERLDEIRGVAAAIQRHKQDLQEAAALDAGFPVKVTSVEIDLSVQHLQTMDEEIPLIAKGNPYGTVATIFPYDAPVVVLARLGGSAILTGNRLRFSLSSHTPRTATLLGDICKPFQFLDPVVGQDNRKFGRHCIEDKDIRVLFISGGSAVGEVYRREYRSFDKLFFAGPGGMPAAIVFKDADVNAASRFIARRAFINGGQYCTTPKKALIHRHRYHEVRDQILDNAKSLRVGDPLDPDTDVGPILVARTRSILKRALQVFSQARLLYGAMDGETVTPMVLETDNETIPDLELFGPFLLLKPFDDPKQAVEELVGTRYGFLLNYFGTPPDGAEKLFRLHFGMVHDNPDFVFTPLRLAFGGKKESGWILERKGDQWIQRDGAFLYSKELCTNPDDGNRT
ncbi:MAG: aldehyde dehydrogenase family protein [Desulfobacterales bacterium]|nr:MAG: aldehyde dehydrogenase family protein [Desulfobacterales bacterium]